MGKDEISRGAKNRMAVLLESDAAETADFAVAMENGILRMGGDEEAWVDLAVVILRDLKTGATAYGTSSGVQFPTEAVGQWAEDGMEGTVGAILAEELKCDAQDPHDSLTRHRFRRADLLEHAIRVAEASLAVRAGIAMPSDV